MGTLLVAIGSFVGFIIAYHTYGRWLSNRIFNLDETAVVPSQQMRDDVDFVPTKKEVIFGHHFTSIAGTGPIVGPAIAVLWGWVPALLWVIFGSIFIGAVHDFGALVVSLRNRGQTIGEVAGRIISPRAKILFLLILFFALTIVLAIFGLVIATIFKIYPSSILPVWISLPIAICVGFWVYKFNGNHWIASLVGLIIVYFCVYLGAYHVDFLVIDADPFAFFNSTMIWTVILLAYCFAASVLPVWVLLQPRDFINSHQLLVALGLMVVGILVACVTGQANLAESAPPIANLADLPSGAPPIWPFLFITIACGAVSGFHCLVSSGTSSKQIANEKDAKFVGYGAMLLEGALAVIVILACCAGVGMGKFNLDKESNNYVIAKTADGEEIKGSDAWNDRYRSKPKWADYNLGAKVGAFVEGGANFLSAIGIPLKLGVCLIAVLVAGFAATTLDTATRLQRYVIQEIGATLRVPPLKNKFAATGVAVVLGGMIAAVPGIYKPSPAVQAVPVKQVATESQIATTLKSGQQDNPPQSLSKSGETKSAVLKPLYGSGGMILWPLFGATNQLLAGLAFMVTVFYLWRRGKTIWFAAIPMCIMLIMPAWAMLWQMFHGAAGTDPGGWFWTMEKNWHLFTFGCILLGLQIWMIIEGILIWPKARNVLEEALPALTPNSNLTSSAGRSC